MPRNWNERLEKSSGTEWKRRRKSGQASKACSGCLGRAEVFHAVAGGDEHRLAQAEHVLHLRERLGQLRIAEGDFFAQLDRHFLEGEAAANDMCAWLNSSQKKSAFSMHDVLRKNVCLA